MDKTKLKKEQVFIRVKDNPELLRKVEQLLRDAGETFYRNTTEGILERGWGLLAMDYDGDWLGTSDRFVESCGLTEVNLRELTYILGGEWDESLDPVTGERRVCDEPDGNEAEGVTGDLSFQTIADAAVRLLEYKNKHYGNSALNPIEVFNGKTKVGQRADDKLSRIKNHPTLRKADVIDLLGYLILMCKENGWSDFSEFED